MTCMLTSSHLYFPSLTDYLSLFTFIGLLGGIYVLYKLTSYEVNIQVIVFTVLAFSQRILKLGLKIRSFSKSTFPGLLKNVLTFNPRWLEDRVLFAQTTLE